MLRCQSINMRFCAVQLEKLDSTFTHPTIRYWKQKKCYPANVQVQESCSKVGLQELLDHTVTRILMTKTENEVTELPNELQMFSKWGCDGSSGHSEYHQKFTDPNDCDKYMFLTSLVPLTLTERNNM